MWPCPGVCFFFCFSLRWLLCLNFFSQEYVISKELTFMSQVRLSVMRLCRLVGRGSGWGERLPEVPTLTCPPVPQFPPLHNKECVPVSSRAAVHFTDISSATVTEGRTHTRIHVYTWIHTHKCTHTSTHARIDFSVLAQKNNWSTAVYISILKCLDVHNSPVCLSCSGILSSPQRTMEKVLSWAHWLFVFYFLLNENYCQLT